MRVDSTAAAVAKLIIACYESLEQGAGPDTGWTVKCIEVSRQLMKEFHVSMDVEIGGPIPGSYSILGMGSTAYLLDKTLISVFSANLRLLLSASKLSL